MKPSTTSVQPASTRSAVLSGHPDAAGCAGRVITRSRAARRSGDLRNNIGMALLELDTIQSYRHNPTMYVELVGNALYTPFVLNYAPLDARFRHIIRRLEKIPALFDQAKANLVDAPEVWNRVAREENEGNIDLIDHTLRQAAPDALKAVL